MFGAALYLLVSVLHASAELSTILRHESERSRHRCKHEVPQNDVLFEPALGNRRLNSTIEQLS